MVADQAEPSKEEFDRWKNDSVTKFVKGLIEEEQKAVKEYLCNGGTLAKDATLSTDYIVGRIQGQNDFLLVAYSDEKERADYGH